MANSRLLEPLSSSISSSPKLLKSVIGKSRVYIRPIQKDLDLSTDSEYTLVEYVHHGVFISIY